jgi:shikimate kinase
MLRNTNLFLIGMMGAGKSTVGRHLAQALGYTFFDTDDLLTTLTGQTVTELFAQGEANFRQLETEVLAQLAPHTRLVVATGGGIVTMPHNWAHLHTGVVVWLDVPAPLLWARISQETVTRPLATDADTFTARLTQRLPLYAQADVTVPGIEAPEVVSALVLTKLQERIGQDQAYIQERIRPSSV